MRRARLAGGGIAVVVLAFALSVAAQSPLQLAYDVDTSGPKVRISGRVVNGGRDDVFEVYVTAEALDRNGKVVARGIAYVDSKIGRGESQTFTATVPAVPAATRYRAKISSYRTGLGAQSP